MTEPRLTERGVSPGGDAWRRFRRNRAAMAGLVVVGTMAVLGYGAPLLARFVTGYSFDEQHTEAALLPPGSRAVGKDFPRFDGDARSFARLDLDGDGAIGGDRELDDLYWVDRFFLFLFDDYDRMADETPVPPRLLHGGPAGYRPDRRIHRNEYPVDFDALVPAFRSEFLGMVRAALPEAEGLDPARLTAAARARWARLPVGRDAVFAAADADGDGFLTWNEINEYRRPYRIFENPDRALQLHDTDGDGRITPDEYRGALVLRTFWLGTDHLGRDVLTRLLFGARISITIALLATFVSFVIGVSWGSVAGYYGGRVDSVMMRVVDVLYGLPFMFVVILLIVIFGRSTVNLFVALGAVQWLTMSRVARGQVLSLKRREFVEAAVALGVPRRKIVFRHLVRNAVGPVIVYSTLMVPAIILEEAFLSFLGLGVQAPSPSWGSMITDGAKVLETAPWLALYPGLFLGLTLFAMNFVGDGLRDALDPQMQGQ